MLLILFGGWLRVKPETNYINKRLDYTGMDIVRRTLLEADEDLELQGLLMIQ